jgi:hypothetical protein
MEQILSWEANSRSASQEFSALDVPEVHYRVRKSPIIIIIMHYYYYYY